MVVSTVIIACTLISGSSLSYKLWSRPHYPWNSIPLYRRLKDSTSVMLRKGEAHFFMPEDKPQILSYPVYTTVTILRHFNFK
jgi:hypothetical protein